MRPQQCYFYARVFHVLTSMVACSGTAAGTRLLISIVLLFAGILLNFREQMLMKAHH